MRELGQYLQQMREARGISREEISRLTRISLLYIVALEDGDYHALPPDIYVRGFIKSYGDILGADIEELLSRYESERPKPKARRIFSGFTKEPPPFESPIPKRQSTRKAFLPKRIQLSRSTIIIGVIAIVVVAVIAIIIFKDRARNSMPVTSVNDVLSSDSAGSNDKKLVSSITLEDLTQEIRLKLGDINPAWALGRADSLTLAIVARQKTWVLVESDYHRSYKGDIDSRDTLRFVAKNAFFLTMGAPNVMHLTVNGFDLAEWPERTYPMDFDINRGNILQLLEGAEQISLPRPPRPNIIGGPPLEPPDTSAAQPQIITRRPGTSIVRNVNTPPEEGPPSGD